MKFTHTDRPTTTGVFVQRPFMPYSPEVATSSSILPFFRCLRTPVPLWLLNAAPLSFGGNLFPVGQGIYQCMGQVPGRSEADFTGQSASDIYLLIPGLCDILLPEACTAMRPQ